jgi:hypothetical protein
MQELNDTIPGPVDLPDPTNIDGGPDTPGVPW